jgi:hypothetical protein
LTPALEGVESGRQQLLLGGIAKIDKHLRVRLGNPERSDECLGVGLAREEGDA